MKKYFPRLIENKIQQKLNSSGAVLVAGPKFCGKTTTCMRFQKSFIKLNTKQVIDVAKINPRGVLNGEAPRLIDDVFDTGKTAAAVKRRFDAIGAEMRLACVYFKPEKNRTNLAPDYFVRDVGSDWLVFPHEIDGLTCAEIAEKDEFLAGLLSSAKK